MGLSVDLHDKGYQPMAVCMQATIMLDGVKQSQCVVADEEAGYVIRQVLPKVVGFSRKGGATKLKRERIKGVVQIMWPEGYVKPWVQV